MTAMILNGAVLVGVGIGAADSQRKHAAFGSSNGGAASTKRVAFIWKESDTLRSMPNNQMLSILKRIDRLQDGMRPKPGKSGVDYVREVREGAMFGYESK